MNKILVVVLFFILTGISFSKEDKKDSFGKFVYEYWSKIVIVDFDSKEIKSIPDSKFDTMRISAWNPLTSEIIIEGEKIGLAAVSVNGKVRTMRYPYRVSHFTNVSINYRGDITATLFSHGAKRSIIYALVGESANKDIALMEGNKGFWHPNDPDTILLSIGSQLYICNIPRKKAGIKRPALILKDAYFPSWNHDGKYIYYDDRKHIYRYCLETKISEKIISGKNASVSEDEKYIIYNSNANYYLYDTVSKKNSYLFPIQYGENRRYKYVFVSWNRNKVIFIKTHSEDRPDLNIAYRAIEGDVFALDALSGVKTNIATLKNFLPGLDFVYIK